MSLAAVCGGSSRIAAVVVAAVVVAAVVVAAGVVAAGVVAMAGVVVGAAAAGVVAAVVAPWPPRELACTGVPERAAGREDAWVLGALGRESV
jgi:hypothetical protein